jgi:two-component system chemotaxis response regulator CheY
MTEANADAGGNAMKLPPTVDLPGAKELLDALRSAHGNGAAMRLDASGVESLTVPYIQILVSVMNAPGAATIVNPSPAFSGAFAELGLTWNEAASASPPPERASAEPAPPSVESASPASPPADAIGSAADGSGEPAGPSAKAGMRILTIDDSKTMRDMLMLTLSSSGFDVIQAVDGQDGIDVLRKEAVDIVITDINMPKMDGYGVIQHLRGDPAYDSTPILVLTTESDREKKERARELGATGFIVKPFNPVSLVEVIRKVCVN